MLMAKRPKLMSLTYRQHISSPTSVTNSDVAETSSHESDKLYMKKVFYIDEMIFLYRKLFNQIVPLCLCPPFHLHKRPKRIINTKLIVEHL